jgi:hypothetical protein
MFLRRVWKMKTATAKKPVSDPPAAPAPAPQEKQESRRIFMYLNADGTIDIANLREATKEKLRNAVRSTPFFQTPVGEAATLPMFGPEVIGVIYGALGAGEAWAVHKWKDIPMSVTARAFAYTPQEIALLTPLTSKIMEKYTGEWFKKYRDEAALLLMLSTLTLQKFELCSQLMHKATIVEMPAPQPPQEVPKEEVH